MKVDVLEPSVFKALDPLDVEGFLRHNAWQRDRFVPGEVAVWSKVDADGARFRVWLPYNHALGDYWESLARLVKTVSKAERRSQLEVLEDLDTLAVGDVIRVRSSDGLYPMRGTLSIDDGFLLFEQARDLIVAAANSVHQARPVHPSQKSNVVKEYLSNLRLGQTERGSYTVKLVSPIKSEQLPLRDCPTPIPFARQAVTKLVSGLTALRKVAEDNHKHGRFVFGMFEETVQEGVSANLCEAVTTTGAMQYKPVEVAVSWSFAIETLAAGKPVGIDIPAQFMSYISEAARLFREKNPEPSEITGYVIALRKEKRALGSITVATAIDNKQRKVRIKLNDDDYHSAVYAHDNELEVICAGDLVQTGQQYYLKSPNGFRVFK